MVWPPLMDAANLLILLSRLPFVRFRVAGAVKSSSLVLDRSKWFSWNFSGCNGFLLLLRTWWCG